MQDNRNECKDEPIQEAVSRTYHQEPENGLDKVALVQLAEAGINRLKMAAKKISYAGLVRNGRTGKGSRACTS